MHKRVARQNLKKTTTTTRFVVNPHLPNSDKREFSTSHSKLIENLSHLNNTLYIYTDGSLLKRSGFQRTGAAAVGYHNQEEVFHLQMGLGRHAESFDAELAGLMMAARRAAAYAQAHREITNVQIFTDCSTALTAVHRTKPAAGQSYLASFCDTITRLLTSDRRIKVTLSWCPSHSGIKGNKRADTLAKEATERARHSLTAPRRHCEWRKSALTGPNRFPPSLNTTHHFTAQKNNPELQCRTAHSHMREFRQRCSLDGQYECPCGEPTTAPGTTTLDTGSRKPPRQSLAPKRKSQHSQTLVHSPAPVQAPIQTTRMNLSLLWTIFMLIFVFTFHCIVYCSPKVLLSTLP